MLISISAIQGWYTEVVKIMHLKILALMSKIDYMMYFSSEIMPEKCAFHDNTVIYDKTL